VNALAVLAAVAMAGAAVGLWAGARRHGVTAARGYRWLSGAALLWSAGLILQPVLAGSPGSSGVPLSLADVAPLLALAAAAIGIGVLAGPGPAPPTPASAPPDVQGLPATAPPAAGRGPVFASSVLPGLADGYVTAVSLLVMGWIAGFGAEYHASSEHPGTFLLDLLHPLADLAVLGALLPVVTVAWQRSLLPYLALLATAGADSLGVGARISGGHEGVLQQLALIVAAITLGASPWARPLAARFLPAAWEHVPHQHRPQRDMPETTAGQGAAALVQDLQAGSADAVEASPDGAVADTPAGSGAAVATVIAAATTGIAALVVLINGVASAPASGLALVIAGGAAVLVVAVRMLMLLRENRVAMGMWRRSGRSLRDLAGRTSDMVLICDLDGTICQADPASGAGVSYPPGELVGRRLAELVHPEDIPLASYVVREALGLPPDVDPLRPPDAAQEDTGTLVADEEALAQAARGRYSCRVRTADGTWQHVECAVQLYQAPGEPPRILVAARDISDEVALRNQVAQLTFHDGLTGLPNRAYLVDRVRATLAGEGGPAAAGPAQDAAGAADAAVPAAVMFLDLDGFTGVNDSAGHGAGDLVLAQAARRLRATVPVRDTVARWGGDEFAVLVENAAGLHEITELAERVAVAIAGTPFKVADQEIALTASIGAAVAGGGEGSPDVLLRNADVALSRAKAGGGDRVEVFAEHMHADVARRMRLASDLKRAIDRDELTLLYQPLVELATSRVIGAESLVRWQHGGEEIPPREFLAVAEELGLSGQLGDWVLRTACEQGARWRAGDWDVIVAVNLSPRQLAGARFPAELAAVLAETGLSPSALVVEVTERVLVEGAGRVTSRLAELRELGVRLAIDDFGMGYASLASLRELPVDIIKIDPSFVCGLGSDAALTLLTRTIAQVGRDLNMEIVAEGIEQPRQLAELKEMGCGYGQGFLLARPMPAADLEAMFRDTASRPAGARASKAGAA
jgi:diguanylate cyclase (GGDEF)-like protein